MTRRRVAGGIALALVVALAGAAWYRWQAPGVDIVRLEVAGSGRQALVVVGEVPDTFRQEIGADWVFIACYLGALLILARLVSRACPWDWLRRAAWPLGGLAALAAVLDVVENTFLLRGLDQLPAGDTAFALARFAAIGKFALIGLAAVLLVTGAVAALVRPAAPSQHPSHGAPPSRAT